MTFSNFAEAQSFLLWAIFGVAVVMGVVANKTNFCTMGAVSDWINMGDTGRIRAWALAIAVAILGVVALEAMGLAQIDSTFPPYRSSQLIWAENLLGGLLFGIGMTLASGCGNKTLIRIGGGNLKSVVVLGVIGLIAFFMVNPFPGTDKTLMSELFIPWIRHAAVTLSSNQDLGSLFAGKDKAPLARLVIGTVLGLGILLVVFRAADFRKNFNNVFGGLMIGLAVLAGWYVSSNAMVQVDGDTVTLQSYVQQWDFLAASDEGKPATTNQVSPQSFTFINPMGQSVGYASSGFKSSLLTAGVVAVLGVILGSFLWSVVSRSFRFEWFASFKDFLNHLIGAILMGFGGVLAMGCTIGQGITGVSTLALGSILSLAAIVFGSALTMKVSYYRMVYEDANFAQALTTALVDMRFLPASMRKLESI